MNTHVMSREDYGKFISLLNILNCKDTFDDVQIVKGKIRSDCTNKIFSLNMDISSLFPYDLNISMIKVNYKSFKLFSNDNVEKVVMNLDDKSLSLSDGITELKMKHPDIACLNNSYLSDDDFSKRLGEVDFFECIIDKSILNKIFTLSDIFSDDKVYVSILDDKIELKMKSKDKNKYSTIISYPCTTIPSVVKKSVALLNISALYNVSDSDKIVFSLSKFNNTVPTADPNNSTNRMAVNVYSKMFDKLVHINTRCILMVNPQAVDNKDEKISITKIDLAKVFEVEIKETKVKKDDIKEVTKKVDEVVKSIVIKEATDGTGKKPEVAEVTITSDPGVSKWTMPQLPSANVQPAPMPIIQTQTPPAIMPTIDFNVVIPKIPTIPNNTSVVLPGPNIASNVPFVAQPISQVKYE